MSTTTFTRREVNLSLLAAALACASPHAPSVRAPIRLFDFAVAGGWHRGLADAAGGIVIGGGKFQNGAASAAFISLIEVAQRSEALTSSESKNTDSHKEFSIHVNNESLYYENY